jgi:hypothetical protein
VSENNIKAPFQEWEPKSIGFYWLGGWQRKVERMESKSCRLNLAWDVERLGSFSLKPFHFTSLKKLSLLSRCWVGTSTTTTQLPYCSPLFWLWRQFFSWLFNFYVFLIVNSKDVPSSQARSWDSN